MPFEFDHIIPRKHRGRTFVAGNLAFSCYYCNVYKGPNLSGLDPASGKWAASIIRDGMSCPTIFVFKEAHSPVAPP